jgi:uncharacterized membrane protein
MPPIGKSSKETQRDIGLERLIFFSDAVMAIAITLLTVDLKLPELTGSVTSRNVLQALAALMPHILSFLISFLVIGVYWTSHHRYFNYIVHVDGKLIGLNLLFLLSIALMPFVAGIMGQYYFLPIGGMIYAGAVALTGFSMSAIWWYATGNHGLLEPGLDKKYIRMHRIILLVGPSMFLLSIPVALINFWFMIGAWWLSPILSFIILRISEGKQKARLPKTY